ncbi:MAG: hypothetical protein NTW67_03625 [Candidatus Woesearchaeota archaeon]|nr:hypothetical protein [Candidatus Woesearchaeota archaeon]
MKNRIFKLPTTVKAGLGGLLLSAIGCAGEYINPITRTQPLVPETPASAPVEPKEQPRPILIEEQEAATEVPVEFTVENKKAFEYLCGIAEKGTPLDDFEQIQLAAKISKKPAEGKATLDDLANAFAEIKGEELKLSYTETIYAEKNQKTAIEELVSKAVKDNNLQQKIEFIKSARCTDKADLVAASDIKVEYKIQDKKAFDEYCKAVEEKDGQTLDEFGKVLLAKALDTDNDGVVTLKEIAQGYAGFAGEAQLSYKQPVFAASGQQITIAALVAKELEGKSVPEKIAFIEKLRRIVEAPKAPQPPSLPKAPPAAPNPTPGKYKEVNVPVQYGFDQSGANRFEQICKFESRSDPYQRLQFAASLDANKDGTVVGKEGGDYVLRKFKQDKKYMSLATTTPSDVKDTANLATLNEKIKVEEGLVDRFSKWLSGKNMYQRAIFLEMKKENPALYEKIDNTIMTALEQK